MRRVAEWSRAARQPVVGHVKKAAASVDGRAGRLPAWKAGLIRQVADEIVAGELDDHFPLYVWQTGSGTQSNMNTNEVISNRAIQLAGGTLGSKSPVHPNDHVNMGQSSNDAFPTAMHIAAVREIHEHLLPSVRALQQAVDRVTGAAEGLYELAMGGTAVGTGLNAPPGLGEQVAAEIADATGHPFTTARNKFATQGGLDAMAGASAGLRALAVPLMKIANDIRRLASGPRCGLDELVLPANEPGSSIMPGKVNPTQCEAMVMVCIQVLSEDGAIAFAGTQGNFELNRDQIDAYVDRSLMLVTALSPVIGYDKASAIAHRADDEDTTLRAAAVASGYISAKDFDRIVDPAAMVGRT
ncbi:class II fumarate hydratase [Streptomyces sp. NPDC048277]|uniref:class II fumarate hydratase n=1 Tax=Streptomyces sp. NPDC048277 TaxID=3155027 RepID=UPI0033F7C049